MAKYILQAGITGVDYWDKNGKIELSEKTTQEQLAYLHSIGHEGVVKIEDKPKK